MPLVDTSSLRVIERLPGWNGRYFHSAYMTFAHYDFMRGSSIHEHFHAEEEVYEVIEGELEVTIDGVAQIAGAGLVAIVPSNVRHSVKALTGDTPRQPSHLIEIWPGWMVDDYDPAVGEGLDRMTDIARHNRN